MAMHLDSESRLSPRYVIEVASGSKDGNELPVSITQYVQRIEYESADGIVDTAKLTISNPDFKISESNLFMPGNELDIYLGYGPRQVGVEGSRLKHIGRIILTRPKVSFPVDGMPTVEVTGYTKDFSMRERRPVVKPVRSKSKKRNVVYTDTTIAEIVSDICQEYRFVEDIDDANWPKGGIVHPARLSDFDVCQAIANAVGFTWWVDWDRDKRSWALHFKSTDNLKEFQDKKYDFTYGTGKGAALLSFEPEMAFDDHFTEIIVQAPNPNPGTKRSQPFIEVPIVEEKDQDADPTWTGTPEKLEGNIESAEALKLFLGDYSFKVIPKATLRNQAQLAEWAKQYFRKMREFFIVGDGEILGLETLMARQVHTLSGMGKPYDGDYYFTRVRHVLDNASGYMCEFSARREVD